MSTKAEKTKQFIIEQAAPIFNEKGIAGTSVDDVLKAAKVAKGCLYNHFDDKADLACEVTDYLLDRISKEVGAVIHKENSAHQKILAYLEFNKETFNTPVQGGCPIFNLAVESDDNNPVIKEKVKSALEGTHKLFTSILKHGIRNGEYHESLNAEEFALKLYASVEGTLLICRVVGTNKPMLTLIRGLKKELEEYLL